MVITDTGDIDEHIPGFCQDVVDGKFNRNWWDVLVAITAHRKSPVAPVGKAEQWLQPRSTELATIADKILGSVRCENLLDPLGIECSALFLESLFARRSNILPSRFQVRF